MSRSRRPKLAVALASAVCALGGGVRLAAAASITVGPGQTYTLTSDMTLDATDTIDARGTVDAPCVIQGNQFQITATDFPGTITISNCRVIGLGATGKAGTTFYLKQTASVRIERSTFSQCGRIEVIADDDADVTISGNEFGADAAVDPSVNLLNSAEAAVALAGQSSKLKLFQGNRVLRSFVGLYMTRRWQIGGLTEAEGNILFGLRASLFISFASEVTIQGNYIRTPAPWDGLNQLVSLRFDGTTTGILVEHNVFRGSNGIVFGNVAGEIRYNVIADPHAAFWASGMHGKTELKFHHNLLLRSEAVEPGALYWEMVGIGVVHDSSETSPTAEPRLQIYNNTMDAADCYNRPGAGVAVEPLEVVASIRNNVFTRMQYTQAAVAAYAGTNQVAPAADPGPAAMAYADYNDFNNVNATKIDNYAVSAVGKTERVDSGFGLHDLGAPDLKNQQEDPRLAGPLPRVFPFGDDDIVAGTVTVCQMLAFYRNAYAPAPGSPLIDAGDPADGPGTDIGAIGAGAAHPDDRFGVECPANVGALPALPATALACPAPATGGSGSGGIGGTPNTPPKFICVCTTARGPSAGEGLAMVVAIAVACGTRRRRRPR